MQSSRTEQEKSPPKSERWNVLEASKGPVSPTNHQLMGLSWGRLGRLREHGQQIFFGSQLLQNNLTGQGPPWNVNTAWVSAHREESLFAFCQKNAAVLKSLSLRYILNLQVKLHGSGVCFYKTFSVPKKAEGRRIK